MKKVLLSLIILTSVFQISCADRSFKTHGTRRTLIKTKADLQKKIDSLQAENDKLQAKINKLQQQVKTLQQKEIQSEAMINKLQAQINKKPTRAPKPMTSAFRSPLLSEFGNMKVKVQSAIDNNNYDQLVAANEKYKTFKAKLSRAKMTQEERNIILIGMAQLENKIEKRFREFEKQNLSSPL